MVSIFSMLREFDAYTKPMDDFRVKTLSGGFVTLIASIAIVCLTILETFNYLQTDVVEQLYVDSSTSDVRVDIHFDITFTRLPCGFITVDVMDVSSDTQENIQHDIYKLKLDKDGRNISDIVQKMDANTNKTVLANSASSVALPACGSCYGAMPEGSCCNTCEEVKDAYAAKGWQVNIEEVEQCKGDEYLKRYMEQKGEGCRVYGKVQVAKVAGNFHFAPGDPYRTQRSHVHDLHSLDPSKFDASHVINHFSFGKEYPGKTYPLDGKVVDKDRGGQMYQYYMKVVPTSYHFLAGHFENSHQFSVTFAEKDLKQGVAGLPGFFVQYEFSPLMVRYEERQKSFTTFMVSLCAIVGGVFAAAQLIDATIYHSSRALQKKLELNKLG